jgi:hypothetical protein
VVVTSSNRTLAPKRMVMLFTVSKGLQLYLRIVKPQNRETLPRQELHQFFVGIGGEAGVAVGNDIEAEIL